MSKHPPAQPNPHVHSGKVQNDTNKTGHQPPTPLNQGHRTPLSRSDRDDRIGSHNQSQARRRPSSGGNRP